MNSKINIHKCQYFILKTPALKQFYEKQEQEQQKFNNAVVIKN